MDDAVNNVKCESSPVIVPSAVVVDVHTAQSLSHSRLLLIAVASFTLVVAFIAVVLLIVPKQLRLSRQDEQEPVLDCGAEMVPIISLLNATGDPCTDLYSYVCSTAEEPDSSYLPPAFRVALAWELERDVCSATSGTGVATERVSLLRPAFLNWLGLDEGERVADFARALLRMGNVSASMTTPQIVRLLAEMSLRYAMAPVVTFGVDPTQSGPATTLQLESNLRCLGVGHQEQTITLAVRAFNDVLNTTLEVNDITELDKELKAFGGEAGGVRNVPQGIDKVPFRDLGESDWQAILRDLVFPTLPNVTELSARDSQRLEELVQFIGNAVNQPAALAYVVTCAAINGVEVLQPETPALSPWLQRSTCGFFGICELDDVVKVECMRSIAADKHARNVFSQVRDAVSSAALKSSSLFFGRSNVTPLVEQLNRVKLLLPSDIVGLGVPFPNMSNSFAANLLALRSHSFEIRRVKLARSIPEARDLFMPEVVRRANVIYIPANLYLFLNLGSTREGIFDLSDLAVGLASELWSFLLDGEWQSQESGLSLPPVRMCFKEKYFNDDSDERTWRTALHAALGLMSAATLNSYSDWYKSCTFNSTRLLKAQTFFLYWVYNRCATFPSAASRRVINAALSSLPFTAEAFSCPPTAPTARRPVCLENLTIWN
ncbi:hypothetical protein HPB49_019747 [Dermacentor silvarum]|uniref:Uncharacterized protein n=1 Tax=Dermacentor silvarum TaxID=543639 RepID=A0ACB8DFF1_DERSI|nr:hypothetical protein HPB49_019747 [Dermacentor silvarum]